MLFTASLLVGVVLGAVAVSIVMMPRVRLILDELLIARRELDRLQTEVISRRNDASQARIQTYKVEQDVNALQRRIEAILAERDEARVAQASAEAAYRQILAELDRLKGEQALARRRRALP